MTDGAHLGVGAERAIETILGGKEQPKESEKQTPEQMLASIREAPISTESYGGTALACARVILEAYERYPVLKGHPTETQYLRGPDGKSVFVDDGLVPLTYDLHDVLKRLHPDEDGPERQVLSDLTGFMWGWAVNAVRYALGDPPQGNPALMTVRTESKV